ncbi:MAG: SH3 domain-containing protein [Chloroflexia bacterium]|nr:SH3 domain-containing protein [Chloroflexia bacterium]
MPALISTEQCNRSVQSFRVASARILLVLLACMLIAPNATAKGPPLATTIFDVDAYISPARDAAVVATIPAGTEVELTGDAAPGFLEVYYDGETVYVPSQYLSLGSQPGIDTAVTVEITPLLDAPRRDADVQLTIGEGQTVILTGASVDSYDAASFDGNGGWIDRRALTR